MSFFTFTITDMSIIVRTQKQVTNKHTRYTNPQKATCDTKGKVNKPILKRGWGMLKANLSCNSRKDVVAFNLA